MAAVVESRGRPVSVDLLSETLFASSPSDALLDAYSDERDYTDHLEDLVSISPQLGSKRSQSHLSRSTSSQTYGRLASPAATTTRASPTRPPPPVAFPHSGPAPSRSPPTSAAASSFPTSSTSSKIPRLGQSKSRSPSPEIVKATGPRPGPSTPRGGSVAMQRGSSDPGVTSSSPSFALDDDARDGDGQGWETLQVSRDDGPRSSQVGPPPEPATPSGSRSPRVSQPSESTMGSRQLTTTTTTTSSTLAPHERRRVQTHNLPKTRLSPGPPNSTSSSSSTASPTSKSSPRTNATTASSTRKPGPNRTNYTPSPSYGPGTATTKKPRAAGSTSSPPIRRKSISTSREYSAYPSFENDVNAFPLPDPNPSSAKPRADLSSKTTTTTIPPMAQWSTSKAPLVFRTSKGELDFSRTFTSGNLAGRSLGGPSIGEHGERTGGGGRATGPGGRLDDADGEGPMTQKKMDDLVLPTVARRLAAERLQALIDRERARERDPNGRGPSRRGRGDDDEEEEEEWIVDEWGVDGLPRNARLVRRGGKKRVGDGETEKDDPEREQGEEVQREGTVDASDHPKAEENPTEPPGSRPSSRGQTSPLTPQVHDKARRSLCGVGKALSPFAKTHAQPTPMLKLEDSATSTSPGLLPPLLEALPLFLPLHTPWPSAHSRRLENPEL
ncbi:hypothetical protein JCM10212_005448 [Sporobolomyces blumeae]